MSPLTLFGVGLAFVVGAQRAKAAPLSPAHRTADGGLALRTNAMYLAVGKVLLIVALIGVALMVALGLGGPEGFSEIVISGMGYNSGVAFVGWAIWWQASKLELTASDRGLYLRRALRSARAIRWPDVHAITGNGRTLAIVSSTGTRITASALMPGYGEFVNTLSLRVPEGIGAEAISRAREHVARLQR